MSNHNISQKDMARKRRSLINRDGDACCYCGKPFDVDAPYGRRMSIEHVVPVRRCGTNRLENLRLAHQDCNQRCSS